MNDTLNLVEQILPYNSASKLLDPTFHRIDWIVFKSTICQLKEYSSLSQASLRNHCEPPVAASLTASLSCTCGIVGARQKSNSSAHGDPHRQVFFACFLCVCDMRIMAFLDATSRATRNKNDRNKIIVVRQPVFI
jgi:hypothetical protein